MTTPEGEARHSYDAAIEVARKRLMTDLDDATRAFDSAMMAACSRFSASEQAARASFWQTRHETWLNLPQGAAGGWLPAPDNRAEYQQGEL